MKKLSEKVTHEGDWLTTKRSTYLTKNNDEIVWEHVERKVSSKIVLVIAKLIPSNRFILIKQYRPPQGGYVMGFPAGLIENGDVESSALKELKEETGYTGKVTSISPRLSLNSGLSNDSSYIVTVEVDEEENKEPKQELEPEEDIEVFIVDRKSAMDFLLEQHDAGVMISAGIWHFFMLPHEV